MFSLFREWEWVWESVVSSRVRADDEEGGVYLCADFESCEYEHCFERLCGVE